MDLALNNLQWLICHKTQQTNQPKLLFMIYMEREESFSFLLEKTN